MEAYVLVSAPISLLFRKEKISFYQITNSFNTIQLIFTEHLLCEKCDAGLWQYNSEENDMHKYLWVVNMLLAAITPLLECTD